MDTILIQLTNQKALRLLNELEELHLIKVLKRNIASEEKLSDKYAGKLNPNVASKLQEYITKGRNEWGTRSI